MDTIFELAGGEQLVRRRNGRCSYELDGEPIESSTLLDLFGGDAVTWDVASRKKLRLAQVVDSS